VTPPIGHGASNASTINVSAATVAASRPASISRRGPPTATVESRRCTSGSVLSSIWVMAASSGNITAAEYP
jgi:hypothetical protein